ncbi:hypothetical protein [Butyrivibrio sp. XBB1001]|uniref:hypothetical protein n=1 Tax=Butyrivibrio sp. XBB1001 TaxID=1280682 RepID=UPI000426B09D|nr:hypothetical protein [Butyrivibrio sp. XBB1001]
MNNEIYNEEFHIGRDKMTRHSANKILQILDDITPISSCVDVGGGIGVWIDEFMKLNNCPKDCLANCVDGSYVTENILVIDKDRFIPRDLEQRLKLDNRYDLAISLEVAEHLPESRARSFVEDLISLSDCVLFSAATIGQTGVGHINEQYMKYWVDLFEQSGFQPFDVVRPMIQEDDNIPWWYKQNIMVFVNKERNDLINCFMNVHTPPLTHMVWNEIFTTTCFREPVKGINNKLRKIWEIIKE